MPSRALTVSVPPKKACCSARFDGLAAGPGVELVDELVVVDVADGQRAVAADAGDDAAQVGGR